MQKYLLILLVFFASKAHSTCNFSTGDYINEMSNPSEIQSIKIDIPKSLKYVRNALKILSSKSRNIPPELKINFHAKLSVQYNFGLCVYPAKVKQSGDWKDHIKLDNYKIRRSLDIRLLEGNVVNAVNFKLFLPHSRGGLNEILGSLILKQLGFISPETFEVVTSINGVNSIMLFQEKSAKELLEKNLRREGPIFEGDESLLWSYKNFENFQLEPLALSRLINDNWFKKGESSRTITLDSIQNLQKAYLEYGYNRHFEKNSMYEIFPNNLESEIFSDFQAVLMAMNAKHALRPHNRKYYFNAIESRFEPIYYDGDIKFKLLNNEELTNLVQTYYQGPSEDVIKSILSLTDSKQLYNLFLKRILKKEKAKNFFDKNIKVFRDNIIKIKLKNLSLNQQANLIKTSISSQSNWYYKHQTENKVEQQIITDIKLNKNSHLIKFKNLETTYTVTSEDLANILSKNEFNNKRTIYIPSKENENSEKKIKVFNSKNKLIKMSKNMKIQVNEDAKVLKFIQKNPLDWALILGGDYSNWKIYFEGMSHSKINNEVLTQRFNKHGLTGCLTIYKSLINQTFFSIIGGGCEDSVNIMNSKGKDLSLIVKNSFADAFDADFSNLSIKFLDIKGARNDCVDFSGGYYVIQKADLKDCYDKAISIGEKSIFNASQIFVNRSNIAISNKDSSIAKISTLVTRDTTLCAEVKKKKQEFEGADLLIENFDCTTPVVTDSNSKFNGNQL